MLEAEVTLEIPFHDVDAMEVAWHGHYVKYFEIARCALLDSIAYNYREMADSGFAWPVIDLRIRYAQPLVFQQQIKVRARLMEWENRLKIDYQISDVLTGRRLSKGMTVQVAVAMDSGEMQYVSPPVLFTKLGLSYE